tara:strand:- start:246 stop:398 length:153 start_codon:yes stop_codon:yes gene_type:complete
MGWLNQQLKTIKETPAAVVGATTNAANQTAGVISRTAKASTKAVKKLKFW